MVGSVSLSLFLYLSLYRSLLPCTSHYYHYFFFYISVFTASSPDLLSLALFRSVYVLSNEGRVRPTATSLPPLPSPLLLRVLNFTLTTSTFYSSRSPIRIPTLLYYSFTFTLDEFASRRLCSPCSCFHATRGLREGGRGSKSVASHRLDHGHSAISSKEISPRGRQPSPTPKKIHPLDDKRAGGEKEVVPETQKGRFFARKNVEQNRDIISAFPRRPGSPQVRVIESTGRNRPGQGELSPRSPFSFPLLLLTRA